MRALPLEVKFICQLLDKEAASTDIKLAGFVLIIITFKFSFRYALSLVNG